MMSVYTEIHTHARNKLIQYFAVTATFTDIDKPVYYTVDIKAC